MKYWLNLFTPPTWKAFRDHGASVSGFPQSIASRADKVAVGDVLVCYLARVSRWCGALEVTKGPYCDSSPVLEKYIDHYIVRFKVKPLVILGPELAIPIDHLWTKLDRTRSLSRETKGWVYKAHLVNSLGLISTHDAEVLMDALALQKSSPSPFPLKAADRRYADPPTRAGRGLSP